VGAALAALAGLGAQCDWFEDPVEENLLPDTSMVECPGAGDVTAGDDVALAWDGEDPDGAVVSYAWTFDDTISGETSDTELVLEDLAEGSHVFAVAAVDNEDGVDPEPATCSFTAGAPGGLVPRVVLAELFTTRPCVNCPNAEAALNTVLDEYGPDSLCIVAYHDLPGAADPLATAETAARIDWYMGTSWQAWPAVVFDGDVDRIVVGALSPETAAAAYRVEIDHRQGIGSPLSMRLEGDAGAGSVTVTVRVADALPAGQHVLRVVVIEDGVISQSHEYDFVARDILDEELLTVSAVGDSTVVERSFTVGPGWNAANLDVIAFVQNDTTKDVLQAVRLND